MKIYMMSIGMEVWTLVEKRYVVPKATPIELKDKKKNLGTCKGFKHSTSWFE
jgi:hypothetical protein